MLKLQRSYFLLEERQDVEGSGARSAEGLFQEFMESASRASQESPLRQALNSSLRPQWWVVYLVASGSVLSSNEAQQNPFAIADARRALGGMLSWWHGLGTLLASM